MSEKRTLEALLNFLDYLKDKGLMKSATAQSRKASTNKVLSVLQKEELEDVTSLNLDDVMVRFNNLHGQQYTPGSLNTYKSRIKAALDDFEAYLDNPLGFKPAMQSRASRAKNVNSNNSSKTTPPVSTKPPPSRYTAPPADASILPIPLRADLTIRIHGLPFDLTNTEANKLAAVIKAMASDG